MDSVEQFRIIAAGIAELETSAERAATANALFGESGVKLGNTILSVGKEVADLQSKVTNATGEIDKMGKGVNELDRELTETERQFRVLRGTLDELEVTKITNANDSITKLKAAGQGAADVIAVELAPAITGLTNELVSYLEANGGIETVMENIVAQAKAAINPLLDVAGAFVDIGVSATNALSNIGTVAKQADTATDGFITRYLKGRYDFITGEDGKGNIIDKMEKNFAIDYVRVFGDDMKIRPNGRIASRDVLSDEDKEFAKQLEAQLRKLTDWLWSCSVQNTIYPLPFRG